MHNSVVCIEYLDGQSDDSEKRDILNFISISTILEPYMNAKAPLSLPIEISGAEDTPILTLVPEPVGPVAAGVGLQQCKSFVEMCIVSCLSALPACICGLVSSTWD
jgi:hypothetical protein